MKKALTILIPIIVIVVIVGGVIFSKISKIVPNNPVGTIGNTAGNLNNQGLFCESDGVIYFSNPADNHYLYKMSSDGTNLEKIMDIPVSYINAGGDYLYFYYDDRGNTKFMGISGNMHGVYRLNKDGKGALYCLDRCVSGIVNLIDNDVYYQHYDNTDGMTLYHATTNGRDKGMSVKAIINPSCVANGSILYPDQDNLFYLNRYTPGATSGSSYIEEQMYNPVISGNYIYYMKVDDDYKIYRYNLSSRTSEKFTNDRVDTFNVYENVVFYQRNKEPALISVNTDGSNAQIIAEGNYSNINCTSQYTYFSPFKEDTLLRTPTFGGGYVEEFNAVAN